MIRKIFLIMCLIFIVPSCLCAEEENLNEDSEIYVRNDVFKAYMQVLNTSLKILTSRLISVEKGIDIFKERMSNFEARMTVLETRMDNLERNMDALKKDLGDLHADMNKNLSDIKKESDRKFDELRTENNKRFEIMQAYINKSFDDMNKHIDDMRKGFYWVIGFFVTLIILPFVRRIAYAVVKWLEAPKINQHDANSNQAVTTEDIEEIINRLLDERFEKNLQDKTEDLL